MEIKNIMQNSEQFLKQISESEDAQEKRGALKIFFGYAPGVGKTCAMLSCAERQIKKGRDVVIGDMDLEMALARKPQIILVEKLAHTNAPGSRHEKRYQDVKELLNAGIDVYTTLNVQHLESLSDKIKGITGVIEQERIPDSIFDEAEAVELADREPEEVAGHEEIRKLTALREIAMRRMADRLDMIQNTVVNQRHETAEHILICLSASPSNQKVIRQAAIMAGAFHGKFTALYVEEHDAEHMSNEEIEQLGENTRLAEQLGAKVVTSYGNDIVEEIAEYAKVSRVTKIVLGRTYASRPFLFVKDSFSGQLSKLAPALEIFLIPDSFERKFEVRKKKFWSSQPEHRPWRADCLWCGLSLFVSTVIAYVFTRLGFSDANLVMVYILGVLMVSLLTSHQVWSIVTSILSVLVFNFFFTEPVKTLSVNDPAYLITFMVMFVTALISSTLTKRVKDYASENARKAYRTEILLETSRKLQDALTLKDIGEKTAEQLGMLLERNIYFYLGRPEEKNPPIAYKVTPDAPDKPGMGELPVAQWTFHNNKHAGRTTRTFPNAKCMFIAVRSSHKVFAVTGIDMGGKKIKAFEEGIMGAILNECAFALEKQELLMERKEGELRLQKEQLRANLLRSISHDLRTPLTSISGNAETLLGNGGRLPDGQKQHIYRDIYDDSIWLINLVENLLSVTRIENGTMELNVQGEIVEDIIEEALRHVNRRGKNQNIHAECDSLLMVKVDVKLMIQVLINLVDNAVKYADAHSEIIIRAVKRADEAVITVEDNGPGIADGDKEKLFQMFYTVNHSVADGRRGMGLGLSLCQSIINAHGSSIRVWDNEPQGTVFEFSLKIEEVVL